MIIRFWEIPWLRTHFGFLLGTAPETMTAVPIAIKEHFVPESRQGKGEEHLFAESGKRGAAVTIRLKTRNADLPRGVETAVGIILGKPESISPDRTADPAVLKRIVLQCRSWLAHIFFGNDEKEPFFAFRRLRWCNVRRTRLP